MEAETVSANENKYIQERVDEEIEYSYTPTDLRNRKYKQTIAQSGFTKETLKAVHQIGFTPAMIDTHIRTIRTRFGFNIGAATSRRSKHTPPAVMPDIVFIEPSRKMVPTTNSATPTTPSMTISTPSTGTGTKMTDTTGKTIGTMLLTGPGSSTEEV